MDPLERPEAQPFRCYQAVVHGQMVADRLLGNVDPLMVMVGGTCRACLEAILGPLVHAPDIPTLPVRPGPIPSRRPDRDLRRSFLCTYEVG